MKSTPHSAITSASSCEHTKRDKGSYQLQRYLREPVGYEARIVVGAAPTLNRMDVLDSSKRNGKKDKERRKAAIRKKIRAIERKIGKL